MFCEKCGTQLQDSDKFCPKCGTPSPVPAESVNEGDTQDAKVSAEQTDVTEQKDSTEQKDLPGQPENNVPAATEDSAEKVSVNAEETKTPTAPAAEGENKKPKSNMTKVLIIVGAAVAVVLAAFIVNISRIGNFIHKTFSSPEKYYQYVEKKNAEELAEIVGDVYKYYVLDRKDIFQTTSNAELTLELGKGGQDILELSGLAGLDLSWLKSASASTSVTVNGDMIGMDITTAVNKDDILSLIMALDMGAGEMYLQIPELTDKYIGLELEEIMGSSYVDDMMDDWEDVREEYDELFDVLPSQAKLEKLLNKYLKIALNCVEDVEKKSKVLKVEGISQKCTALKVTLDNRTLADIFDAILDEAEKDEALEAIIVDVVDASGEDGDDAYDELLDELEYLQRYYKNARGMEDIVMTVYVDGKGNVVGRELEADGATVSLLMPEKGNKFGYEFSVKSRSDKYALTGSGKRSGDKIDGDFNVRYNGTSILEIAADNFDLETLKRGQLNGKLDVSLGSGIGKVAGSVSGLSVLQDMKFVIKSKTSGHSLEYSFGVIYDDEDMGTLIVSTDRKRASGVKTPSAKNVVFVEDERDMEDWLEEIVWDKVVSKLEKTDLPKDAIDFVEDLGEAIEDGDVEDMLEDMMYYFWRNYYRYNYGF